MLLWTYPRLVFLVFFFSDMYQVVESPGYMVVLLLQSHKKIIRYLGIHQPKEVKGPYSENYKTLMKKLKMTKRDGKNTVFLNWKD